MLAELVAPVIKIGILIILVIYSIFALLIVRQVDNMSKTLRTPLSGVVRMVAIIHAGVAIGLIVLMFGVLND